jgi:hypothetical protein
MFLTTLFSDSSSTWYENVYISQISVCLISLRLYLIRLIYWYLGDTSYTCSYRIPCMTKMYIYVNMRPVSLRDSVSLKMNCCRSKMQRNVLNKIVKIQYTVFMMAQFLRSNNHLSAELNPSAQRCLTRFFTGDFASWTVHFVHICVKNQQMYQLFIQYINYVW